MFVSEVGVSNPRTSSVEVSVNVYDINDNYPEFPPGGYVVTMTEGDGRREVVQVI